MSDKNKLILLVIAAVVLIGTVVYLTVYGGLAKIQAAFGQTQTSTSSTGSTTGSSSSTTGSTTGATGSLNVAVTAADASDIAVRTWAIYASNPGAYTGAGAYSGGAPAASGFYPSGSTANFSIPGSPSTLYLVITQSGGSGYGTYAGTITVNGNAIPFQGVDANHPFQFSP